MTGRANRASSVIERDVDALARRWFIAAAERDNPDTNLDSRHGTGIAWTLGNGVTTLVHGASYFRELLAEVSACCAGDRVWFTDWRGDPDERLDGPGTEVGAVLAAAAERGVDVRGLVWRSHLDRFRFSAQENRHLGIEIDEAGGQCLLDQRVRVFGSHHQKLVLVRHPDRPADDVAFVGGIDLCHSRRDDVTHDGDPQAVAMAAVYGPRPPWHDVQLAVRGPAVGDVEAVFRERWEDPAPLSRNPLSRLEDRRRGEQTRPRPMPPQPPDGERVGSTAVQLLRTYPRRRSAYPFARRGERSVARAYTKALAQAETLVYIEDQYLWSLDVADVLAGALTRAPELRMVIVIPAHPDVDGRFGVRPQLLGREGLLRRLREAGGERVGVYSLENAQGTPIYVHAKVCVVDDAWACIGSDNANRRSWTHDSELSAAFVDTVGTARRLRHELSREHLGVDDGGMDLDDAVGWAAAFAESAAALDLWHSRSRQGARPRGRLRRYAQPALSRWTRTWAAVPYSLLVDPDGRSRAMRRAGRF